MFVLLASGSFHLALQVAVRGRSLSTASGYLLVLDRCSQVQATVLVGSKQSERCYVKAVEDGGVFLQKHTILSVLTFLYSTFVHQFCLFSATKNFRSGLRTEETCFS